MGDSSAATERSIPRTRIGELVQRLADNAQKLEACMEEHGHPPLTFDVSGAADFPQQPEEMRRYRGEIISTARELAQLACGPKESLRWGIWEFLDNLALFVINKYEIANLFPYNETISLSELQARSSLDPVNLARCLHTCISNRIFCEPLPGIIAHTAASRALNEDEALRNWIAFNAEEMFPAAGHVLEAIEMYPEADLQTRTGFTFANGTADVEPMFVTLGRDAARARRMGRAMASLTGGEGYEPKYLIDVVGGGYDFSSLDAAGGVFVDIGGSHGFICLELAEVYKNLTFIVQDLPRTVESAPQPIHGDSQIASRIKFQAHDFFTEQPAKGADVFFFRWIFHNYSKPYAVRILQNLVPALKPGARIIINDVCLRDGGEENPWDQLLTCRMDLVMFAALNAQERTEAEFRALFQEASDGYVFLGVSRPNGSRMSIIEAVWRPDGPNEDDEIDDDSLSMKVISDGEGRGLGDPIDPPSGTA
ncbi:S-adenosyl-L-methionine-dependent methyltransferase [Thozetella sp. PMI_491]|nr:S-adenosyl-L-methionine-dependent methyltransferase [Thozetella sp. PMI_491]